MWNSQTTIIKREKEKQRNICGIYFIVYMAVFIVRIEPNARAKIWAFLVKKSSNCIFLNEKNSKLTSFF